LNFETRWGNVDQLHADKLLLETKEKRYRCYLCGSAICSHPKLLLRGKAILKRLQQERATFSAGVPGWTSNFGSGPGTDGWMDY